MAARASCCWAASPRFAAGEQAVSAGQLLHRGGEVGFEGAAAAAGHQRQRLVGSGSQHVDPGLREGFDLLGTVGLLVLRCACAVVHEAVSQTSAISTADVAASTPGLTTRWVRRMRHDLGTDEGGQCDQPERHGQPREAGGVAPIGGQLAGLAS